MRPVRLTMQAFVAYPGRQTVDFRDAVSAGLFGLYGATGSGKSTVFDAMTFALFGEVASGEAGAVPFLRSHLADPETPTQVELLFDLGDRRYLLRRMPEQERPRKRGTGTTKTAHTAYLFDATGLAPEDITAERCGTIIAEKKVGPVDAAVADLLGYSAKQFRQIVLLPQGRFETFLTANTKDRLPILRDLFDVSLYRRLAAHLKEAADTAERGIRTEREVCARRLDAEGFESREALDAGIETARDALALLVTAETTARDAVEKARQAMQEADALNTRFDKVEEAQDALAALEGDAPRINALQTQVEGADRARGLLDAEQRVADEAAHLEQTKDAVTDKTTLAEEAKERAKSTAALLAKEHARQGELDALRRRADDLTRHAGTIEQAAAASKMLEEAKGKARTAIATHDEAVKALHALREDGRAREAALEQTRAIEGQRQQLVLEINTLETEQASAHAFETAKEAVGATLAKVEQRQTRHDEALRKRTETRQALDEAEAALSTVQALHLAAKLEPGAPCPVCGACEHPAPATGTPDHAGRDEAFRDARAAFERADAAERQADTDLQTARGVLAERRTQQEALTPPARSVATLAEAIGAARTALDRLGPSFDEDTARRTLDTLQGNIREAEESVETLRTAQATCETEAAAAKAALETMLAPVPEPLRDREVLDAEQARVNSALSARQKALDDAETAARSASDEALSATKDRESAATRLTERRTAHENATTAFETGLSGAGFTTESFTALKPAIATLDADREAITAHTVALGVVTQAAEATAAAISGLTRPDLDGLAQGEADAQTALSTATESCVAQKQRLSHLTTLRDDLAETLACLDEAERESGPLRALAALCNGANEQKQDLETYAIGTMFDRVLDATNLRYGPMTQYRYRLERTVEGMGRGRRGLGMQVFDTHTGQARPTISLSGGERFIAALSLALGLADTVESTSGKVRLDTVFIDEGFGSLDTQGGTGTLDRVLHVLRSLVGEHRAVGLISHVPLVQEVIPNGFFVHKSPQGSRIETREGL